ncbi:phosphotransferase family protein [Kribbella solani]|uniref:Aminoglycoside phosphotransferase (APT) family kinase protein n=1 Tax=Kribbella solani TaxID=236067 RepID=A0A841DVK5_9ACTN|nr:phosphotransferase [Kribbella solani]MBB5982139.1 aminoglycoside phosphotransferase (APT) family kinase protein [Kribbella solani]
MELRVSDRDPAAFQQPLTAEEIEAVCQRAFGLEAVVAVELGFGGYNSVYLVDLRGRDEPVILRAAPEEAVQYGSERRLMRNEYATVPWLATIAPLMPRVLAVDWSHEVIDRDWMIQTRVPGIPAPEHLGTYPRSCRTTFFRQLGAITRAVHDVRGPHFGRVDSTGYDSWSDAVVASLAQIADDLARLNLDATDVHRLTAIARQNHAILDEIKEPRLLTGDLWTVNCLLVADAPEPQISGVLDFDRTEFGDPAADWTIRMAQAKPDERTSFWDTYGTPPESPATWRSALYEARHLATLRLERHRLANPQAVQSTYPEIARLLTALS